ncbi:MAG: outer membrane protein assembly factor BamA, partial [Bacteroidetes bacterium]|nr:outer membrane protein assembly factor BamA [Bacteroidota bacterium]
MRLRALFFVLTLLAGALPSAAQVGNTVSSAAAAGGISPEIVEILGISVEGASDDYANSFIQQTSRLQVGQRLTLPGDPALGDAIRSIYRLRTYEDIQIVQERRVGQGVYLVIRVREVPKLRDYEFLGVKKGHAKDLR